MVVTSAFGRAQTSTLCWMCKFVKQFTRTCSAQRSLSIIHQTSRLILIGIVDQRSKHLPESRSLQEGGRCENKLEMIEVDNMAPPSESSPLSSLLTKLNLAAEEDLSSASSLNSHAKLLALVHELILVVESPMETVQRIIYQVTFL